MSITGNIRLDGLASPVSIRAPRPAIIEGDIAKIPLGVGAKNGYAIVDKEYAWIADKYKWHLANTGYAAHKDGKASILMHRLVIGTVRQGYVVDHINREKLDNRRSNLREATRSENYLNSGLTKANTSGYKNISFDKHTSKYHVQLSRCGVKVYNEQFMTLGAAIKERDKALIKFGV